MPLLQTQKGDWLVLLDQEHVIHVLEHSALAVCEIHSLPSNRVTVVEEDDGLHHNYTNTLLNTNIVNLPSVKN